MEIVTDWTLDGKKAEALSYTLRLLKRRFTTFPAELTEQIEKLDTEQLENLGEALLDFTSLADLTNWLEEQRKKN
jgi:hypothetical protein